MQCLQSCSLSLFVDLINKMFLRINKSLEFELYYLQFINNSNLDIMIGQELIITEEIDFSEPNFLCEIGSIVDGNSCGKF